MKVVQTGLPTVMIKPYGVLCGNIQDTA